MVAKMMFKKVMHFCGKHGNSSHLDIFGTLQCEYCAFENSVKELQYNQVYKQRQSFLMDLKTANLTDAVPVKDWEVYAHDLQQESVLAELRNWVVDAIHTKGAKNLLLLGGVGTGKTYCAKSLARSFIGMGLSARFYTTRFIINTHSQRFASDGYNPNIVEYKRFMEFLYNVDCLVLDDLGNNDEKHDIILEILEARHDRKKPTIITSNLDYAGLELYLGERVCDRLYQNCISFVFSWDSYRKLSKSTQFTMTGLANYA